MTAWVLYLLFGSLAGISLLVLVLELREDYRNFRGTRIVTCPETGKKTAIALNAWKAALPAAFGKMPVLQLIDCSRWPEACGCDERCLSQVTLAPHETLLRSILEERYQAQNCAFCGDSFQRDSRTMVRALVSSDGSVIDVVEIPPDRIEELVASHEPVCVRCFGQMALAPGQKAYFTGARPVGDL
jgi:hypothetical protein